MRSLLFGMLICCCQVVHAQAPKFTIHIEKENLTQELAENGIVPVKEKPAAFSIKINSPGKTFLISKGEEVADVEFAGDNAEHSIDCKSLSFDEKREALFQIKEKGTEPVLLQFKLLAAGGDGQRVDTGNKGNTGSRLPSFDTFWDGLGFNIDPKPYGLIVKEGNTRYKGAQYVHIFLDQYGNSIEGTIPQGIADRQYVVHVIYLTGNKKDLVIFDVKKTKGRFNPALNFLNSDIRSTVTEATSGKEGLTQDFSWVHREFLLGISTTDVEFELTRTTVADPAKPYVYKNDKIAAYTINMTPTYHGSFNVGIVNSRLEHPTYTLVESAENADRQVVKQTGGGNRGVVTAMATVYTSPVILIEKLFNKDIPWNKTYGRNFLDDHSFFERIYPALGVGFTDKTLENIFYGVNWEIVRGGGIFFGWHWGKVTTFRTDGDFKFEKTAISAAEFELRKNEEWRTKFSIGVNVDPIIIARLFSGGIK